MDRMVESFSRVVPTRRRAFIMENSNRLNHRKSKASLSPPRHLPRSSGIPDRKILYQYQ